MQSGKTSSFDAVERLMQRREVSSLDTVERTFGRLMRYLELLLAGVFIVAVALNFIGVLGRYLFNASIFGSDEIQIYIMVWITFVGAAVVSWRNEHLRMDVVLMLFPRAVRMAVFVVELVLALSLTVMMLIQSGHYVALMHALNRKSDLGGTPMWIPHTALALGFGLVAAVTIWRIVVFLLRRVGYQEHSQSEQ